MSVVKRRSHANDISNSPALPAPSHSPSPSPPPPKKSAFSPQPAALQNKRDVKRFFDEENDDGDDDKDRTALNLAFQETRWLPDISGEERVKWAAGVLRIDLTETGIRT